MRNLIKQKNKIAKQTEQRAAGKNKEDRQKQNIVLSWNAKREHQNQQKKNRKTVWLNHAKSWKFQLVFGGKKQGAVPKGPLSVHKNIFGGGSSKSARKVCKEQHQQQQQSGKVFHIKVCSRESSRKIAGLGLGNFQCVFVVFPSLSFRLSKITLNKLVRKDLGGILSGVAAKMLLALWNLWFP